MMAFEAQFAGDEAAAGISNTGNDIGSFHSGHLADDMYARWVQLGPLAQQANATGLPIIRPLYLDYPGSSAAYTNPGEYLYGDNVLAAPIVSPDDANGNGSVSAWDPAGHLDRLLHRHHLHRAVHRHHHRPAQ
jgi:alpha-glucosidase (family GH31 glycosyl hydrolase)